MRLGLDSGAADGEVLNALSKLRESLKEHGPNPHELVDALQNAGLALEEEAPLPPAPMKPDYGLCKIPFGPNKGTLFMDASPYELRQIRKWCLATREKKARFADLIHDIEQFLSL